MESYSRVKFGMLTKGKFIMSRFTKLTEIREMSQRWPSHIRNYELNEIIVNTDKIVALRDASYFKKEMKIHKGYPAGLDERIFLTEVALNIPSEANLIYVVGDFESIAKKIGVGVE